MNPAQFTAFAACIGSGALLGSFEQRKDEFQVSPGTWPSLAEAIAGYGSPIICAIAIWPSTSWATLAIVLTGLAAGRHISVQRARARRFRGGFDSYLNFRRFWSAIAIIALTLLTAGLEGWVERPPF